jgi:periplasmic protein TonB
MSLLKGNTLSRSGGVILAVAIHLLVIYVIATSLGIVKVPNFVKPMEAVIIESPQEPQKFEPVETQPDLAKPNLEMEQTIPEIPVEVPLEEAPPAEQVTTSPAPPAPAEVSNLSVKNRVEPVYPASSRRAGEEGTVTFRVLVDPNGRPTDIAVSQSSGHARLDQAAMEAIKKWRFAAAMNGGSAVAAYTTVRVTFRLDAAQ